MFTSNLDLSAGTSESGMATRRTPNPYLSSNQAPQGCLQSYAVRHRSFLAPLTRGHIGIELGLLVIPTILLIFFFPSPQGPYSVVHGPATAFRGLRSAARAHASIAHGMSSIVDNPRVLLVAALMWPVPPKSQSHPVQKAESEVVLRC